MIHEPGPRAGVHELGRQGWSTDRASVFCKCPEIFAVIRILALNTRNNGKAAKLPKVKLNFARRSFYFLVASIFNSLPLSLSLKSINSNLRNINSNCKALDDFYL